MLTDIICSLHILSRKADKLIADVASSCKTDIFEKYRKEAQSIASCQSTAQLRENKPEQENVKRKDTVCPTDISEPSRIHLHFKNRKLHEKVSDFENFLSNKCSKVAENNNSKFDTAFKSKRKKTKFEPETKNFDSKCISTNNIIRTSNVPSVSSTTVSANENASNHAHSTPPSSNSKCVFQEYRNIDMKQEVEKEDYYAVQTISISRVTHVFHSSNFASSNVEDLNIPNQENHCESPSNSEKTANIPHGLKENDTLQSNVMSSSMVEDITNTLLLRHLNETKENSSCDNSDENYKSISGMPHPMTANDSEIRIEDCISLDVNDTTTVLDDHSDENPGLASDSDQSSASVEEIFSTYNNREIKSLSSINDIKVSTGFPNCITVNMPLEPSSDSRTATDRNPLANREKYCVNVTAEPIKRGESNGIMSKDENSIFDCIGGSNCYSSPINKRYAPIGPSNSTDFANKNVCEMPHETNSGEVDSLIDSFHTPSTRAVPDVIPLNPRKRKLSKFDFYKLRSVVKEVPKERRAKNKTKATAKEVDVLTEAAHGKASEHYDSISPQQTQNAACVVIDLHSEMAPDQECVPISAENITRLTTSTVVGTTPVSVNTTQDATAVHQPSLLSTISHRIEIENSSNREFSNLSSAGVKCSKRSAISRLDGKKPSRCYRPSHRPSLTRYCGACKEPLCSGFRKVTAKEGEAKNRGSKRMNEKTRENQIRRRAKLERSEKIRLPEQKRRYLQKHEERLKKKIENRKTGFKKLNNGKADCDVIPNESTETDRTFWVASSRQGEGHCGNLDPISFPPEAKVDRKIFLRQSVVLTDCLGEQSKESKAEKSTRSTSSSSMGGTSKGSDSETRSNRSKKYHWGRKCQLNKDGSTEIFKDVKQVGGTKKYRYNAESGSNLQNPSRQMEHTPTTSIGTFNSMTYVKSKVKGVNRYLKTPSIRRGRPPVALKRKVHFEAEELSDKKARIGTLFAPAQSGSPDDPKLRMRTSVALEDVFNLYGAPLDVAQLSHQQKAPKKQLQGFPKDPKLSRIVSDVVNNTDGPFDTKTTKVPKSKLKKKRERGAASINSEITSYELTDMEGASDEERVSVDQNKVPQWAKGVHLKHALLKQCYEYPNGDEIFEDSKQCKTIDLDDVFCTNTPRYHTRTSSAKWTSPD